MIPTLKTSRVLRLFAWALALAFVLGYGYIGLRDFLTGPRITVTAPQNGSHINAKQTSVSGLAERVSRITFNDRAIFIDEHGRFQESLLLADGYNIIEIVGYDRFNRSTEVVLEITHE